MSAFFTHMGVRPEYLGNYTGSSYQIKLSDFYNKRIASHEKCSQLYQKFIVGAVCLMNSGLAKSSSTTGFSVDYSNKENMLIDVTIPQKMLDAFGECRFSFILQAFAIKVGKIIIDNFKNSAKEEEKKAFESKTLKEIPEEYLSFATKTEAYYAAYEKNSLVDDETSLNLIRELTLFTLEGVLNKNTFYRELFVQYESELISYLENIKESDFNWNFEGASPAEKTKSTFSLR